MRSIILALAIAAIAAAAACGQQIAGPDQVEAGKPVWYTLTDVPPPMQAVWIPSPELQAGPPHIRDGHALFCAADPGEYKLVAIVAVLDDDGRLKQLLPMTRQVKVTGEAPSPDPFYPEPNPAWKTAVKPVLTTKPPRPYAIARAQRFSRFAESVRRGDVTTVGELHALMGRETAEGSWPATRAAVAAVIDRAIGRAGDVELDPGEAERMLLAIAWALVEATQ